MKSRLQIAGHPVHVMTVGVPIGLYTAAFIADALYVLVHDAFWYRMAFWCIALGLLGNLAAVLTGLPDFFAIKKDAPLAWNAATTHLVIGLGLVLLYVVNLALHNWGDPLAGGDSLLPFILSLVGAGLLGLQGWYGGELVFRHKVGVEGTDGGGMHEGHQKRKGAH
jgi:uncharacterized membrane protein